MSMKIKSMLSKLAVLSVVVLVGATLLNYEQQIKDWWFLRSYEPSSQVAQLAVDSYMSDKGRDIFYVTSPQLNDKATFNQNCQFPEHDLVLGCFNGSDIFVLDVEPGKTEIVEPVTAAHEMLHAVYARLSPGEKKDIDSQLDLVMARVEDPSVLEVVEEYSGAQTANLHNELHSIFGTQLEDVGADLELHFSRYFTDRASLVVKAKQYEQVFDEIEAQIASYDTELAELRSKIAQNEDQLSGWAGEISTSRSRLKSLLADDKIGDYNAQVPVFNRLISRYNQTVESTKALVDRHNEVVSVRNALVVEESDLVKSLDSNYQEETN